MKKSIVAIAITLTIISSPVFAWDNNGSGGIMQMGGSLTLPPVPNPWEVEVGTSVTNLDTQIIPGVTNITVPVKTAIPVLGIRPKASNRTFYGGTGISPQINFNNAYNTASISNDTGVLTLDVTDASSNKIGTLRVNMKSGAIITEKKSTGGEINSISVFASKAGDAFFGGLATQASGVGAPGLIFNKFPGLKQNIDTIGGSGSCGSSCTATRFPLTSANNQYNGFYTAIIDDGENIQISLTQPSTREAIQWKASLPVTVSYM